VIAETFESFESSAVSSCERFKEVQRMEEQRADGLDESLRL